MKTVTWAMAITTAFSVSIVAQEKAKSTIAFDVPPQIKEHTRKRITYENLKVVDEDDSPVYVVRADIVGQGDNGLTVRVWLTPGMSQDSGARSSRCIEPECKLVPPPPERVWRAFIEAFNQVLIQNSDGFGQHIAKRCVSSTLQWTDVELQSKLRPELGWRYRMARIDSAETSSHYYFELIKRVSSAVGRFVADSTVDDLRKRAHAHIRTLCDSQSDDLRQVMFVAQYGSRRPSSQTTVGNTRPLQGGGR